MGDKREIITTDKSNSNILSQLSVFIDHHIKETKLVVIGFGLVGFAIIGRSILIGKKFHSLKDLPARFIQGHVQLQGNVADIKSPGVLLVDHIPIISLRRKRTNHEQYLPVSMYGLEMTNDVENWLRANALQKTIWFRLMCAGDDSVDSLVTVRMGLWRTVVNENLLKEGITKCHHLQQSEDPLITKWNVRLAKAELQAQRRGRGIWSKPLSAKQMRPSSFITGFFMRTKDKLLSIFSRKSA